ncbi:hypothetical protein PAECIP111893_00620 [Paenibacillus plantiphilus]|uniref:Phage phiEco32-like COOH.NH2 ligase-type 2 n=1 Tax=Paenibacillus plantiphilus TaxID=2905650 RepID=A0ABM9BWZ6_9BACL|nr:hypothetical protein [Paenibacillus plantiphilus]CAH1195136.1 hypothetical protein PAECIP111893_00620 [Paenibacillus plantiphilus]
MSGKIWTWDAEGRAFGEFPRAWADGIPEGDDSIIVCGSSPLPSHWRDGSCEPLILNRGAAAYAAASWQELARRLQRAGAAVLESPGSSGRRFIVSIFNLQTIEVRRIAIEPSMSGLRNPSAFAANRRNQSRILLAAADPMFRRLSRAAVKALYAVGLENGRVDMSVADSGSCKVSAIHLPDGEELQKGIWARAIAVYRGQRSRSANGKPHDEDLLRIGADPEFLLLSEEGKVVSAATYLEGGYGTGCDAVVIGGRIMYPVAELRPAPAGSPDELAANIRRLLVQANTRIRDRRLRWAAGAMPVAGFALGGHIHLSGVPLTGRLLRQLDSYAALLLALIETPSEGARRPRFGTLGDCRMQPHGGFEYRTLPSWLLSPLAAKAAFALALLCARESHALAYRPMEDETIVDAYYSADYEVLRTCVEPLASAMRETASYAELGRWIEPLLAAIRRREHWDAATDVRVKWRIPIQE